MFFLQVVDNTPDKEENDIVPCDSQQNESQNSETKPASEKKKTFSYKKLVFLIIPVVILLAGLSVFIIKNNSKKSIIGEWESIEDSSVIYVFNEDGTGSNEEISFTWESESRNQLLKIYIDGNTYDSFLDDSANELYEFFFGTDSEEDTEEDTQAEENSESNGGVSENIFEISKDDGKLILICQESNSDENFKKITNEPVFDVGESIILVPKGTRQKEVIEKAHKFSDGKNIDYPDEVAFENALNAGENVVGKTVTFLVKSVHPDSFYGFNLWSGEHLNFVCEEDNGITEGQVITAKITESEQILDNHYILNCKIIEIDGTEQ